MLNLDLMVCGAYNCKPRLATASHRSRISRGGFFSLLLFFLMLRPASEGRISVAAAGGEGQGGKPEEIFTLIRLFWKPLKLMVTRTRWNMRMMEREAKHRFWRRSKPKVRAQKHRRSGRRTGALASWVASQRPKSKSMCAGGQ